MREALQTIIDNWQAILEYALMFIMYFLVFLYNAKVRSTKTNLTTLFQQKVPYAEKELADAKKAYEEAVAEIKELKLELATYKKALCILVETEENTDERLKNEG